MLRKIFKLSIVNIILILFLFKSAYSEIINEIKIFGNDRISKETILMFSDIKDKENLDSENLNKILKNLYNTNFFKDVSLKIQNNILLINVIENPIIQSIKYEGIKAKKIKDLISNNTNLKSRSSYDEFILNKDKEKIQLLLKELGYYFPEINIFTEELDDNKINLTYEIKLGDKAKIKKISFIGDKKFKDKKLKSIIVSEENKFWKFITNKKFVNENIISLDKRLLKNFYLNKGYYDVIIDSSFAKLVNKNDFELIYNIKANEKFYFNDLSIDLPNDFNRDNFEEINVFLKELKGKTYSVDIIEEILEELDKVTLL